MKISTTLANLVGAIIVFAVPFAVLYTIQAFTL